MEDVRRIAERVHEGSTTPGPLTRALSAQATALFRHILTGSHAEVEASWVTLCALVKDVERVEWERDALRATLLRSSDVN